MPAFPVSFSSLVARGKRHPIQNRDEAPSLDKGDKAAKKWVDISICDHTLIAYEGQRALDIVRVSTGLGELSDPEKTHATKRGVFTLKGKHLTATMTGDEGIDNDELADVPYVHNFEGGDALHACRRQCARGGGPGSPEIRRTRRRTWRGSRAAPRGRRRR